ncbi:MAG TPA: response regulator [Sphingobacteriaceae bacterium]
MQHFERNNSSILIAEDDPDDRLMLQEAFNENNINDTLSFVESGDKVMTFLRSALDEQSIPLPNLILLDLNMPKLDGRGVLKQLKADPETQDIPVVILTTSKAEEDRQSVFELGASDFFTKPASFNELVEITSSILQKWFLNNNSLKNQIAT